MITHQTQVTSTQPGEPEHKPDEPEMPVAPSPEEMPTTEPKHFPIHREIPEQPIHEPMPDRPWSTSHVASAARPVTRSMRGRDAATRQRTPRVCSLHDDVE